MAPRSYWKGYLKLSLVTCRVQMMPATSGAEQVRFRTISRASGNRVQQQLVDAETGKPVEDEEQVRGYERAEGDYVVIEDADLDTIALDSVRTISIDSFVAQDSIGWIWRDTPHYLLPEDKVSTEAYAVIRDAMAATNMVGIARLVMGGRERAVMLVPKDRGIVLWTLRFGDEVRDPDDAFPDALPVPDRAAVALVEKLIGQQRTDWDPAMVSDPMQAALLDLVAEKRKGQKKAAPTKKTPAPEGKVINIMEALKRSLAAEKAQ